MALKELEVKYAAKRNPGTQYAFEISDKARGALKADYQRIRSQWFDIANTPGAHRYTVDQVNVNLSFGTDAETISL